MMMMMMIPDLNHVVVTVVAPCNLVYGLGFE